MEQNRNKKTGKGKVRVFLLLLSVLLGESYFFPSHSHTPMPPYVMAAMAFLGGMFMGGAFTEKVKEQPLLQYVMLLVASNAVSATIIELGFVGEWLKLVVACAGLLLFILSFKFTFKPLSG